MRVGDLAHFGHDALDLALLLPRDSFCALENVGFVRYATHKLPMIFGIIEAGVNHLLDQISKRTSSRIGSGIRDFAY